MKLRRSSSTLRATSLALILTLLFPATTAPAMAPGPAPAEPPSSSLGNGFFWWQIYSYLGGVAG